MRCVLVIIGFLLSALVCDSTFAQRSSSDIQKLIQDREVSNNDAITLMKKFAPLIFLDKKESHAVRDPSDFIESSDEGSPGGRLRNEEDQVWLDGKYSAQDVMRYAMMNPTVDIAIDPVDSRRGINFSVDTTIRRGQGVFADIRHMVNDQYSLKYFIFFDWNETAYSGGHGNHQGDWLCIDFQIRVPEGPYGDLDIEAAKILYGLLHNHGRVLLVPRFMFQPSKQCEGHRQPSVFLERGTHEPWPQGGGRGLSGWPRGTKTNKTFGPGEGFKSEHKIVREHEAGGPTYCTVDAVQDILVSGSVSAYIVRHFMGRWGTHAEDADVLGWELYDATNPRGPLDNSKMWERSFVGREFQSDPLSADVWIQVVD